MHLRIKYIFVITDTINNVENFRLWQVVLVTLM